ncbi:MAG: ImmA/IrrE family metallo-endopeptidase [Leptospiraceae bacterium]|nr:ImmA/IrrE family metallo-endopeptidase [Leptospiraceae bacterium]
MMILRERNLAKRIIDKHKLSVPIPIEDIIRNYATIEETSIPFNCDALCINKENGKPNIIINSGQTNNRKRFTLSHELGHIIIPWHVGNFFCHTDYTLRFEDEFYFEIEAEANKFAAELLLPHEWILSNLKGRIDFVEMVNLLRKANVSDWTLLIRLKEYLPPGYIIKLQNNSNEIIMSYKSNGSLGVDSYFATDKTSFNSSNSSTKYNYLPSLGNYSIYWVYVEDRNNDFEITEELSKEYQSSISTEILNFIIEEIFHIPKPKLRNQINGIIGAGNTMYPSETLKGLFINLTHRFRERNEDLNLIINHPLFKIFIYLKAKEIMNKKVIIQD